MINKPGTQSLNCDVSSSCRFHQKSPITKNGMKLPWLSSDSCPIGLYALYIHKKSDGVWTYPRIELPRNWNSASQAASRTKKKVLLGNCCQQPTVSCQKSPADLMG